MRNRLNKHDHRWERERKIAVSEITPSGKIGIIIEQVVDLKLPEHARNRFQGRPGGRNLLIGGVGMIGTLVDIFFARRLPFSLVSELRRRSVLSEFYEFLFTLELDRLSRRVGKPACPIVVLILNTRASEEVNRGIMFLACHWTRTSSRVSSVS